MKFWNQKKGSGRGLGSDIVGSYCRARQDLNPCFSHGHVFAMFSSILGDFDAQSTGYDLNMQGKIETWALPDEMKFVPMYKMSPGGLRCPKRLRSGIEFSTCGLRTRLNATVREVESTAHIALEKLRFRHSLTIGLSPISLKWISCVTIF